jgi:hypothetical protein
VRFFVNHLGRVYIMEAGFLRGHLSRFIVMVELHLNCVPLLLLILGFLEAIGLWEMEALI